MKTDELIAMLARGADAPEPSDWRKNWKLRLALALGVGFVVATLLGIVFLHIRPDIGVNIDSVLLKAAFAAMIAVLSLPLALRLMRPGQDLGWRAGAALAFMIIAIIIGLVSLAGAAPQQRLAKLMGGGFPWCVALVPLLAAPTAAMLVWLMRGFAPTNLALAGAAIGGVAGGVGAMAYAMYCPVDSVAFVTIWYSVAIALCAALGSLIASRFLRW